ncbi:hypothetical protein [Streptomyces sp. NPDC017991]|uniref:hypothetical protein n=1 Tax=Streptomyces sp. NPDC017991 TaxID=3365026 RepID=UPI00378D1E8E
MLTFGDRFPEFDLTACVSPAKSEEFVLTEIAAFGKLDDGFAERAAPMEVLRGLDALRTDELCPCDRTKGETTLDPVELPAGE